MSKIIGIIFVALLTFITSTMAAVNEEVVAAKDGIFMVVATVPPADKTKKEDSVQLGTGFIIGYNKILTNYHVIGDKAIKIELAMEDMEYVYTARMVAGDKGSDIAILQLDDWDSFAKDHPHWRILPWAPNAPELTEDVYVIGHPWGMAYSVSKGIVSMAISPPEDAIPRWMIQTDAHVYEGNSGGPLLDDRGRVLGMNTLMRADTGGSYGFAIPNKLLIKMIKDLEKYSQVRWASLGMNIAGTEHEIKAIGQGSAAEKAGLKIGDKIAWFSADVGFNHDEKVESLNWLIWRLSMLDNADPIWLVVNRNGTSIRIKIQPGYRTSEEILKVNATTVPAPQQNK